MHDIALLIFNHYSYFTFSQNSCTKLDTNQVFGLRKKGSNLLFNNAKFDNLTLNYSITYI